MTTILNDRTTLDVQEKLNKITVITYMRQHTRTNTYQG